MLGRAAELTNLPIALGPASAGCAPIAGSAGVVFPPLRVADETVGTPTQIGIIEYRGVAESGSEETLSEQEISVMPIICEYRPEDLRHVEDCFVALQDFLHGLEPQVREGKAATQYFDDMFARCTDTLRCSVSMECWGSV